MSGPLSGVKVLDLTAVVAGPYATMWLGDMGADVIKVEPPAGDTTRQAGHQRHPGMGSVFLTLGRNKRSLGLDLKQPDALTVLHDLVREVDVFIHNMRPEPAGRLGIDFASLAPLNRGLVHATVAGFDLAGPYAGRPAYDDMIQGLTGIVAGMQAVYGEPGYAPMIFADKTVGLAAANAICAALYHRERSGHGQAIVIPMFEVMTAFNLVEHLWDATFEPPLGPPGYVRVLSPQRRPYRTADGWICALPYQDKHFQALFVALERPDLAADPRFATIASRLAHIDEVLAILATLFAGRSTAAWLEILDAAGIPAVPIHSMAQLLKDPHLQATGFFEAIDHPSEGPLRQPRNGVQFSASGQAPPAPAPRRGQHNAEILQACGYSRERLERLAESGVLHQEAGDD